jgi:hypothetical protein
MLGLNLNAAIMQEYSGERVGRQAEDLPARDPLLHCSGLWSSEQRLEIMRRIRFLAPPVSQQLRPCRIQRPAGRLAPTSLRVRPSSGGIRATNRLRGEAVPRQPLGGSSGRGDAEQQGGFDHPRAHEPPGLRNS